MNVAAFSIRNAGLRRADFRCGFYFTRLRTGREAAGLLRRSIPIWGRAGGVWQHGRGDIGELLVQSWKIGSGFGGQLRLTEFREGRSLERVSWLICRRGTSWAGQLLETATILGRDGSIFGGSRGAAELTSVWRGWLGWTGSVKMR